MLTALIRRKFSIVVEAAMKRVSLVVLLIAMSAMYASAQQSLAEAARQAQSDKKAVPAKHVYTNDDIVTPEEAPAKPAATGATAGDAKAAPDAKEADKTDKEKTDKKDNKEEVAKASAELKQKIADQQKAVTDQDHEISIMEREHQIKVAEYYADAGTQLRTSGQWFEDEKKYQSDLQTKKQALADAKAKLDDLNDQARKSGAPGS
jgi:hypothetical protein